MSALKNIHFPLLWKFLQEEVTVTHPLSNGFIILATFYPERTSFTFIRCSHFHILKLFIQISSECLQALRKLERLSTSHWRGDLPGRSSIVASVALGGKTLCVPESRLTSQLCYVVGVRRRHLFSCQLASVVMAVHWQIVKVNPLCDLISVSILIFQKIQQRAYRCPAAWQAEALRVTGRPGEPSGPWAACGSILDEYEDKFSENPVLLSRGWTHIAKRNTLHLSSLIVAASLHTDHNLCHTFVILPW